MQSIVSAIIFVLAIIAIIAITILIYKRKINEESITNTDPKEEKYREKKAKKVEEKIKTKKPSTP